MLFICFVLSSVEQLAIPVVPTVRVVITFTKFVELQPVEQFFTPLSSPRHFFHAGQARSHPEDDQKSLPSTSTSTLSAPSWLRRNNSQSASASKQHHHHHQNGGATAQTENPDPFAIPSGYAWTTSVDDKSRSKMKKSKSVRKSK